MSKHLQRDLETLERQVLAQASLVEEMIQNDLYPVIRSTR